MAIDFEHRGGGVAFALRQLYGQSIPTWPRLVLEALIMLAIYIGMLFVSDRFFYLELLRALRKPPSVKEKELVSA